MFNSNQNEQIKRQLQANKQKTAALLKQFVLQEFINLFFDANIQAMLLESDLEVMERGTFRWVSAIACYSNLGKQIKQEIEMNSQQWVVFRDETGVLEVEIFTRPFHDPSGCITRIDLKSLGGWNDSPVKQGVRPALIW